MVRLLKMMDKQMQKRKKKKLRLILEKQRFKRLEKEALKQRV
tara:strand:- start:442 stop:567 length:126 start_codon:yes stop_codon:yes gene_type:complete